MDLTKLMAEDSARKEVHLPSDDELQTVGELANKQLMLEEKVAKAKQDLKDLEDQLTNVREVALPKALESYGLTSVTLLDKSRIIIKEQVHAGITEDNREAAFEWLEATDNDGIIKNEIKCPFGKGQDAEAKKLADLLASNGYSFTNSKSVHPQTLKAFVRQQLENGLPVPTDVFSIHIQTIAVIELPKKR